MEEKKLAVIALGGNAILRGNQKGTVEDRTKISGRLWRI